MNAPLSFFDNVLGAFGMNKSAPLNAGCAFCKKPAAIDLGDGDYVCQKCWDNWIPYGEFGDE